MATQVAFKRRFASCMKIHNIHNDVKMMSVASGFLLHKNVLKVKINYLFILRKFIIFIMTLTWWAGEWRHGPDFLRFMEARADKSAVTHFAQPFCNHHHSQRHHHCHHRRHYHYRSPTDKSVTRRPTNHLVIIIIVNIVLFADIIYLSHTFVFPTCYVFTHPAYDFGPV